MSPHAGNTPPAAAASSNANGTCPGQSNPALASDQSTPQPQAQPQQPPPVYSSILVSISGDSKISLQHASVQQLTVIPEGRELVLPPTPAANTNGGGQSPQIYSDEEDGGDRSPYQPVDYDDDDEDGGGGIRDLVDEEDENEDDELEPTFLIQDPAPDGGYGWVIVLSSFMCNLIVDGIAYTFGLLVDILVNEFNSNAGTVTLCASLLSGFYLSVGPVVSALANRFGCRAVGISGALLAAAALFLSTLSPNITMLIIVYGIFGGCGFGMIYLPALVSVGYYFNTKRAFATGIAVCGSGVGALVFAPLVSFMLNVMNWRQTFLVLGSLVLLCAFFSYLVRPLELHAQTVLEVEEEVIMEEDEEEDADGQADGHGGGRNQMYRKPLMQRIAEEKRRRLLSHSNSQFLLMMQQNGSIDIHDPAYGELRTRLMMNTEPGVHSTLYLDQLFGGGGAYGSNTGVVHGWGTPSRTSTPSLQSAHQSLAQLGDNASRQQLSPIIEKKVTETSGSAAASNDQLASNGNNSSGEDSSGEETITIIAKPQDPYPKMPSFEPPEESEKKEDEEEEKEEEKVEQEEKKVEKEESDIISQLSVKLDIPESIAEEPEPQEGEDEEVATKTTAPDATNNKQEEEKDIVSIVSEKTPTNSVRGTPQRKSSITGDSILTLPQSPVSIAGPHDRRAMNNNEHLVRSGGSFVDSTTSGSVCRSRRSMTVRSDRSDCSSHQQLLQPPLAQLALSASGGLLGSPVGPAGSNMPLPQMPVQVILSTTPAQSSCKLSGSGDGNANHEGGGEQRMTTSSQRIAIRPLAKKDIFYTGSTKALYAAEAQSMGGSRLAHGPGELGIGMGQSMVSIPTRDIIEKVWKQLREQEEKMAGGEEEDEEGLDDEKSNVDGMRLRRRKNFCNKVAKIICPFRENVADCFRGKRPAATELSELNGQNGDRLEDIEAGELADGEQRQLQQQQPSEPWYRRWTKLPPSMKSILKEMLDVSLLYESRSFIWLCLSNVLGMLGFYVPYFFVTQFATSSVLDEGEPVSKEKASLIISVMGLTNMIGRLLFGWLSDVIACRNIGGNGRFQLTALALNNICVLFAGVSVCVMPYCTTYVSLSGTCLVYGLFISAYICLTSIILVDMLGLERLTNAFGLLSLFRGVASMIGPPLGGIVYNFNDSYKALFVAAGLMLILSAIMGFFIDAKPAPIDRAMRKGADKQQQQQATSDDEYEGYNNSVA